jgi:hypothetical protein
LTLSWPFLAQGQPLSSSRAIRSILEALAEHTASPISIVGG